MAGETDSVYRQSARTPKQLAIIAINPDGKDLLGGEEDLEASGNGSAIAILKRLRTLLGGVGSFRVTDGVDELEINPDGTVSVLASIRTDELRAGTTVLTPKFATIAAGTAGDNIAVAGVATKKLRVVSIAVVAAAAVNIYFTTAVGGTVIFGGSTNKINFAATGGFVLGFNPVGWFETVAGQALVVNLSGAVALSGGLAYVEV